MFKSGFLIFIFVKEHLISVKKPENLPNLYKNLLINNKINLMKNKFNIVNMNSLRFIMIKLGIIYKEIYMIENGMNCLQNYDMKTANLLMQYILETSDIDYVVKNENDNFYIYIIRTTIIYLIKLFKIRTQHLKNNPNTKKSKYLKNLHFLKYYNSIKEFKELIILSKYLDVLRELENEIYYKRKICHDSLILKKNSMCIKIQDKDINNLDINYLKKQLFLGKLSDSQNYIMTKIHKSLPNVININILNKVIVELYCYRLLLDSDMFSVCINILRNVSSNPNIFFRNIAMKTQNRPLRTYLLNHLKHSRFKSYLDSKFEKLIRYLDENYSNPSFKVEYSKKSFKILLMKEFKKMKFEMENSMINKNYSINSDLMRTITAEKKEIIDKADKKNLVKSTDKKYKKGESFKNNNKYCILAEKNINLINEFLEISNKEFNNQNSAIFLEIYDDFFANYEMDDFGMNKQDLNKPPHFLESSLIRLLSHLIFNYFNDNEEKNFIYSNNNKVYDCINCKTKISDQDKIKKNPFLPIKRSHLGYANISIENLKFFDILDILRIKFDDYIDSYYVKNKTNEFNLKNISFHSKNIFEIKSIFKYINDHYLTNLLTVFMQKLISTLYFQKNFIDENKIITSDYFSKHHKSFSILNDKMQIFKFNENSFITDIIQTNFIKNGILIEQYEKIDINKIKNLIINNLFPMKHRTYCRYLKFKGSLGNKKLNSEEYLKRIFFYLNHHKFSVNNSSERKSKIDSKMDSFIFKTENYYLLQNFIDFNLLNPIILNNYKEINIWQKIIMLTKFNTFTNIFEISLENLRINIESREIDKNWEDFNLIFFGSLIFLKLENVINNGIFKNNQKLRTLLERPLSIPTILQKKFHNESINKFKINQDFLENKIIDDSFFNNNVYTCQKDISIKDLINNYYKFFKLTTVMEWETRYDNSTINLDDFEILIENGRVIDAYYHFCEKMTNVSQKDINSYLYIICLNNLLNYNVFSAAVTFLYLSNIETKQLKVQIEAANRVILNDLNNLSKNSKNLIYIKVNSDIFNIVNFVKVKNFNKFNRKYFEISEETISQNLKDIILIYKDIILAFQQFTKPNAIVDETSMQSKPILQILRNLEEATWNMESSPSISNNNEGRDISLDSPWHLVSLFCKIHNLHMSLTLLHELGRNNDWIMFLYESQVQECPPQTVLQILHDYFTIETLTTHLKIIMRELVDSKADDHNTNIAINNQNNSVNTDNNKIFSKNDFPNSNFLEFVIYNYKIRAINNNNKHNQINYILDPIYIMNLAENPKEKTNKMHLILNEAILINSKDLIMVSLLFSNFEEDKKFICLSLHLYMTIKEIFLSENKNHGMIGNSKIFMSSIKNLKEMFDNRKKNIKLIDLENIINFLLLNNHSQVLLEALNLFDIYYSFDEFVKFCKCFSDNDFENAFIHLFVFKNSMNIVFKEHNIEEILSLMEEEKELQENISRIKDINHLILIFFYQVSNSVIKNLIQLYEKDRFKLFKLLEILYLSKWNKKYSYYFKNLCILDNIKGKGKTLNYKSSFNLIVECLIQEKNFNDLSEFILSYEENIEDDTLLYKIFSIIKSFEKNYVLYNDEERKQFWDCIEIILKDSNLQNVSVAKFFFYILEIQENKLYIKEQLIIIFKIYSYLSKSSQYLKQKDKLTIFMRNVIGYEIDNNINENYILKDLENKIFIIIFSNCKFEKLSKFFNKPEFFKIEYIKDNFNLLLNELYEESSAINFNKMSKNFWIKLNQESSTTVINNNIIKSDISNNGMKLVNFNDSLKISCINLLNLNNKGLTENLCNFYKLEIDLLKKFISYKNFIQENLNILKKFEFNILNTLFQDAKIHKFQNTFNFSKFFIVKSYENSICEELYRKLKSCLEYKSIERIVLYELLKLLISSRIEQDQEYFIDFDNIHKEILNQLIEYPSQENETLIKYLNKLIDIDDLLADIIVQKYIENSSKLPINNNNEELNYSKSLFKYVRLFRYPSKLGLAIKQKLIKQGFDFGQNFNSIFPNGTINNPNDLNNSEVLKIINPYNWELILMGYYSFLYDCHSELINFNNIIYSLTHHYNLTSFNSIFKFFQFFEENERVNEIFYCMNKILFKNQIKNYQKINNYDVFSGSKSEIEFYFKSKNFKKLGEIYVKLAKDYSSIIQTKKKKEENELIFKKQQELTILNLYIKAAELFLMDNCVLNYSKVLEDINNLINNNFNDEIDINLEK